MTDHSRFRAADRADVYKNGRHAATLTRSGSGEVSFAYLEDYLPGVKSLNAREFMDVYNAAYQRYAPA